MVVSNTNRRYTNVLVCIIFAYAFLLLPFSTYSQKIDSHFIKDNITKDVGTIVFNVVKIYNLEEEAIRIKPLIKLPKSWKMFSSNFGDTLIKPGDSISFALRLKVPQNAIAEVSNHIMLQVFSNKNQLIHENQFTIKSKIFHQWQIISPKERIYFYPGNDRAEFQLTFRNTGNTREIISLDMVADKKINVFTINEGDIPNSIILDAAEDTTIRFLAKYTFSEERIFDLSKVQIYAYTEDDRQYRAVLLEKYSDTHNPFEIDRTLPHQAEIGFRTFNNNSEILPFVKTSGRAELGEESDFRYNFTYYDLTQTENIIANSYYNFLYSRNDLKVGLGAFSSMLGRNLYNRNSIMVSHKLKISKTGSLEGFASYGFLEPKASAAIGYIYEKEDVNMNSSVSYDYDSYRKVNTASFVYHSNKIKVAKGHDISANVYAYNEQHYMNNNYSLTGVAWDLNYFGRISKALSLQLANNYGSPNIPGPQMGLVNFMAKATLSANNPKNYFSFKYVNTTKNYYYMSYEGFKLPSIYLHDQYAVILYNSSSSKIHRWAAGPSIEFYNSRKPISASSEEKADFNIKKYRIEYRSFIGTKLMLSAKAGVGDFIYKETEEIKDMRYDFHILGDYNFGGYGLRFSYDYGPMVNSGIYQFAIDASNNSMNISPYAIKQVFKGRLSISLFANIAYRFDLKYGSVNINPKIEAYLFKDWYAVASGTYSYINQQFKGSNISANYYYTEFSIKKRWGKSDYKKWQKDLRRVKIVFFKDNNGNGVKDEYEEGVPHVKARLLLINSADQKRTSNFPIDLTLLSNDKGNVIFSRIPMGFYELSITPLTDQKEYFYVNKSSDLIEVTKTDVYYVPFQKASKIEGRIDVAHRKYSKEEEHIRDLANIKVTAFNNQGNSYSAFTRKDGSFSLFAPGNNTYFLRISNVFGKDYRILKNDLRVELPEPEYAVFKVMEQNRQIRFKTVDQKSSEQTQTQKVKIVEGKIYESHEQRLSEQNPLPEFNLKDKAAETQMMDESKYYVVLAVIDDFNMALDYVKILRENGLYTTIGTQQTNNKFYVYYNYYSSRAEAKAETKKLKASGIKNVEIINNP